MFTSMSPLRTVETLTEMALPAPLRSALRRHEAALQVLMGGLPPYAGRRP